MSAVVFDFPRSAATVREQGKPVLDSTWTTSLDGFATWMRAGNASPETIRVRLCYLRQLAALGVPPWRVTSQQLAEFMAMRDWSAETRHAARTSLRRFYTWGVKTGQIADSPAADLPSITVPRGNPRPVPEVVLAAALAGADAVLRAMLMLGAYEGLRRAEIASLHSRDVTDTTLRITGKGGHVRLIPLHPAVRAALPKLEGYLFPGSVEGHISPNRVGIVLKTALGQDWSAHKLRHRFATAAYAAERDLLAVQQLLGHASPVTTRIYTAIPAEALNRAVLAAGPVSA